MATADSVQGREYDFIRLDLATPGGRAYPLGFLTDVRRTCVGLPRAKSGLRIVGDENVRDVSLGGEDVDAVLDPGQGGAAVAAID